jgi:hypothetical protein
MRYALLEQARDLAILIGDAPDVLSTTDQLSAGYVGIDAAAAKKQALARIHSLPAAAMMIRLLANPDDAEANTAVGRYYGLDLQDWPTALPLLARGNDAALKKLSEMELAAPTGADHQAEIGDGWYEQSKKASDAVKDALYARALHWYEQAEGSLTGMGKTATTKRIAEIKSVIIKEGVTDWANLTPAQWERIHAPVFDVQMGKPRNDVPTQSIPDYPCRILPCPTDVWRVSVMGKDDPVTAKGDPQTQVGGFQAGELLMALGTGRPERYTDLSQATPVSLMAATTVSTTAPGTPGGPGAGGGRRGGGAGLGVTVVTPNTGVIRVKFMAIDSH